MKMAKGTVEKRQLTEEEIADARRLKAIWLKFKKKHCVNQEWLSEKTQLGVQSLMGQYLNGHIQLNHKAILAFARVLNVRPSDISPSMKFPNIDLDKRQERLLHAFEATHDDFKDHLLLTAEGYSQAHPMIQGEAVAPPKRGTLLRIRKK